MFNIKIDSSNNVLSAGYCDFVLELTTGVTQKELPEGTVIPDMIRNNVVYNPADQTFTSTPK